MNPKLRMSNIYLSRNICLMLTNHFSVFYSFISLSESCVCWDGKSTDSLQSSIICLFFFYGNINEFTRARPIKIETKIRLVTLVGVFGWWCTYVYVCTNEFTLITHWKQISYLIRLMSKKWDVMCVTVIHNNRARTQFSRKTQKYDRYLFWWKTKYRKTWVGGIETGTYMRHRLRHRAVIQYYSCRRALTRLNFDKLEIDDAGTWVYHDNKNSDCNYHVVCFFFVELACGFSVTCIRVSW